MWYKIILFLIINFTALAIGSTFTAEGVSSDWYSQLNKVPWTPPGYMFGIAWSTIMICFAFYMAKLHQTILHKKQLVFIFTIQWILNTAWNPVFFYLHNAIIGLIIIINLTITVTYMLFKYKSSIKTYSLLILPYFIWLLIATSLNAYIVLMN